MREFSIKLHFAAVAVMQKPFSVPLMVVTCLTLLPSGEQVQSSQTQLLLQLQRQLESPAQLQPWNSGADPCYIPPSPTLAVTCDSGTITELKIIGDRLKRPRLFNGYAVPNFTLSEGFVLDSFVTTLVRLNTLRVVILVALGLWGPIPDKVHRFDSLEQLDLSSNFLYGSIPPKLSAMTELQMLIMDGNYLNGTMPDWLNSFSNLSILRLQGNQLGGPLPESIGSITALSELAIASNKLSGKVPDLSRLSKLELLDLRDNELDGELQLLPTGVKTVLLSNNSLHGQIPEQFLQLTHLQHLDLSFNLLEGAPPEGLFSLPNITYLNLATNMLSGSLHSSMVCSGTLSYVDLSSNRLYGDFPPCLFSSRRTTKFDGNCFSGQSQQHDKAKYCQDKYLNGSWSKNDEIGFVAAFIGGIIFMVLMLSVVYFVFCRRICRKAVAEQRLLPSSGPSNSVGLSSELLANARYISQSMKLGTQVLPTYKVFSVEELREATKDFDRSFLIGEGTIGKIYKGRLENGMLVAIRCLAVSKQYSIRNLKLRLDLLAKLRHPNLVCLLGHCVDSTVDDSCAKRIFLIYEYVPNGTLNTFLSGGSLERVLNWTDRLQILIGIAKAIHFLHTGIIPGSTYNRLKTSSVLLDEHLVAKLSDYGLSILTEEIYKHGGMAENPGYNFINDSKLEKEILEDDVCCFGCIVLEMLMGPELFEKGKALGFNGLIRSISSQEHHDHIIDQVVRETSSEDSLLVVISITTKCLSFEASTRPSIEEVLWNLQYAMQVQLTADGEQRSDLTSQPSQRM